MPTKTKVHMWLPTVEEAEEYLSKRTIQQTAAIKAIIKQYGLYRSGFKNLTKETQKRPIGIFLFPGPSKVGKTKIGFDLAEMFYGTTEAATRIPMGSYKEGHEVSDLIGSPFGYIGHGQPPTLSKKRLYANIPGYKEKEEEYANQDEDDAPSEKTTQGNMMDFLIQQQFLHEINKKELEEALTELSLINYSLNFYQNELANIKKEEKSSGKRSRQIEENKSYIKRVLNDLQLRREIILASYYQSLLFTGKNLPEKRDHHPDPENTRQIPVSTEEPPATAIHAESIPSVKEENEDPILIIILDEIEKAHPDIFDFLLGVFYDGKVPLRNGEIVDFSKTFFIMTSNLAAKVISKILRKKSQTMGFVSAQEKNGHIKTAIDREIEKTFKPEFINRIDDIVIFEDLTPQSLLAILEMQINEFSRNLEGQFVGLIVTEEAKKNIILRAQERPESQAEGVLKQFKFQITVPLSELFSRDNIKQGEVIIADFENNQKQVVFKRKKPKPVK